MSYIQMNIKYSKPQNFWVSVFNIKIIFKTQFPILTVFAILKKKFSISWNIKKHLKNPGLQIAVPVTYETRMFYLRLSRALTRVKICLPCRTATVKHAFLVWAGRGETCFRMHEFGTGMKFGTNSFWQHEGDWQHPANTHAFLVQNPN